jgi:hypothetical protein
MDKSKKKITIIIVIIIILIFGTALSILLLRLKRDDDSSSLKELNYLVVSEWDIKFVIPDEITDVRYKIRDDVIAFVAKPTGADVEYVANLDSEFFDYAKNRIIRGAIGSSGFESGIVIGDYSFVSFRLLTPNNLFGDIDNAVGLENMTFDSLDKMRDSIQSATE